MRRPTRTLASALVGVLAATVLAACGGSSDEPDGPDEAVDAGAGDEQAEEGAGGVFPAIVEHKFGTTTVPEEPQRVVSVGLAEQDTLLAHQYLLENLTPKLEKAALGESPTSFPC